MIHMGKCPKCDKVVSHVVTEDVSMNVGFHPRWKGFSYSCSHCRAVLGVEINPLCISDDIIAGVVKELRRQ